MKTWDDWSDFDINLAVAKVLGFVVSKESHGHSDVEARGDDGYHAWFTIDYCNNWADMGPIIDEKRINLNAYDAPEQGWTATSDTSFFVDSDNPLRAAAIVYLMMNGVKP